MAYGRIQKNVVIAHSGILNNGQWKITNIAHMTRFKI